MWRTDRSEQADGWLLCRLVSAEGHNTSPKSQTMSLLNYWFQLFIRRDLSGDVLISGLGESPVVYFFKDSFWKVFGP